MKRSVKIAVATAALALLGVLMGLLAGLFEEKIEPGRLASAPTPVVGQMAEVRLHRVPRVERAVGTLQPAEETEVAARILAEVVAVNVSEGSMVTAGDVLVELDRREVGARVEQARQQISAAQAALEKAQSRYARIEELAERGVAAAAELDSASAELKTARAQLSRAKEGLKEAEASLSYTMLKAPISGRVIHRRVDSGDTVSPGNPLVHLYDPEQLRLEVRVRESVAAFLSVGDRLRAKIDAPGIEVETTLVEIVPAADAGSRSFVVRARMPSRDGLYPGMFGRLLIPVGVEEHISVPADAIRRIGQLEYVLLTDQGGAVRRYVRTGDTRHDGRIEVLSGLAAGEQVVMQSEHGIGEGVHTED